ncbi:hypothetical protein ACP70R_017496 [Stipagrostis hirtigluma subsp. patula]
MSHQQVSSSQPAENVEQLKTCRCGDGEPNFQITNTSETGVSSPTTCPNCQVLKSGYLLLSSKGIGWTVWKKRWFILTRKSLVFFRSDPNVPPPRGSEPIVTLGGIDLNDTGSIVVKEERKLLTVSFPDGRDGRTFTLKAETTEDLNEWRSALENALAQAPSEVNTAEEHPKVSTDIQKPVETATEQSEDKSVVGRPAEFALVEADGSPAFLEKALKFIEDYGLKVEGILRQSADVEEVKRRLRDFENGKNEFSPEEDAHVIGDCIKYILREMPSSPVPAPCCTALVRAYRMDKKRRFDAMNRVIYEVFPEPNRQLLQRILKMMQIVGSQKAVNRMSPSALAACMAPLLLRPLLLGECEIDSDFSMAGDSSFQLLQAAAAANHAQAIVIILLEEYDQIFDDEDDSYSSEAYTESDIPEDDGSYVSGEDDMEEDLDHNTEHSSGGSECDSNIRIDNTDDKVRKDLSTEETGRCTDNDDEAHIKKLENSKGLLHSKITDEVKENAILQTSLERRKGTLHERRLALEKEVENLRDQLQKERSLRASLESGLMNMRRGQVSFPSTIDSKTKADLEEVATAEADIMNLKQKVSDLRVQLNNQVELSSTSLCESCNKRLQNTDKLVEDEQNAALSSESGSSIEAMADTEQSRKHTTQHSPSSADKHNTNTGVASKGETDKDGQDGPVSSNWNFALQYSNIPLTSRLQGINAHSRAKPEENGGAGAPSALAKLTNRLNFLKERRALLASEMQNLDLARPSAPTAPPKDSG